MNPYSDLPDRYWDGSEIVRQAVIYLFSPFDTADMEELDKRTSMAKRVTIIQTYLPTLLLPKV